MSQSTQQHRQAAPKAVRCAVVTVSDTRTLENDRGGQLLEESLAAAGHTVTRREIVPDDPNRIRSLVEDLADANLLDAILITGGTGIAARDQTYETVSQLLTKTLPGYGELFRMLSYAEIGATAMLSRAVGGLVQHTVVLTMPGSPAGVRLAMEKVILPDLAHLIREARR